MNGDYLSSDRLTRDRIAIGREGASAGQTQQTQLVTFSAAALHRPPLRERLQVRLWLLALSRSKSDASSSFPSLAPTSNSSFAVFLNSTVFRCPPLLLMRSPLSLSPPQVVVRARPPILRQRNPSTAFLLTVAGKDHFELPVSSVSLRKRTC